MLPIFDDDLIDLLTGSAWTYPILLGICLGDAVLPALPSETAVIVCGIQAARGQLSLGWVIACAALGAFLGDNASYSAGRCLLIFGTSRQQFRRFPTTFNSRRTVYRSGS